MMRETYQKVLKQITAAHKKGHEFFLCTGRSKAEITEDVLALPLSGMIGAGGGCASAR